MSKTSTGHKADATFVMRAVSSGYDSWNKRSVRAQVVRSLVAAKPSRVLELCAGGHGVREMVGAGLSVLVVDDGRDKRIAEAGITRPRYRRAMEVFAEGLGQESRWGKAHKFTCEADAAFLDFMGPWSKEMRLTLESSRHMKAVAATFMLDRMELGESGKLTEQDWIDALIGLAERTTYMRVRWWRVYRRNSYQQKALVLFLRPAPHAGTVSKCECGAFVWPGRRKCENCRSRRNGRAPGRKSDARYFASDRERYLFRKKQEYQRDKERAAQNGARRYATKTGRSVEDVQASRAARASRIALIRSLLEQGMTTRQVADAVGVSVALACYHKKVLAAVSGTAAEAVNCGDAA